MTRRFAMPPTDAVDLTGKAILQVVPELDVGGAEITTLEMTRAIVAAGARAWVASAGGTLEPQITAAGGRIARLPVASKNPFTMWRNAGRLARLIKTERIDLMHTRSRAPGWSGWLAARRTHIAFMTTYHSSVQSAPRAKVFYNSVLVRGRVTIANSHYTAAQIAKVYPDMRHKLRVIPRGCDVAALAQNRFSTAQRLAKRAQWGVAGDAFVILCPARITHLKGQHVLLAALAQLGTTQRPYLVLLGGTQGRDGYVAELKTQAQNAGLADRLVFAGLEDDMACAYAAANLAIVPSIRPEPFGRTIIEAQAASLPVIATDAGGFRETVIAAAPQNGGTGWLVKINDAAALAEAIDAALAMSPDRFSALGANGRQNVEAHYTQTAMCNRTLNVYRELIG